MNDFIKFGADEKICKSIALRVRERRKELNMTQRELSEAIGRGNPHYICDYEKGKRVPGAVSLTKLALVLEVPTDWLLGLTDSKDI